MARMTRPRGKVCAICKFGNADGVALFNTPGDRDWACAKHLRFVSSTPVTPQGQAVVNGLADGSIQRRDAAAAELERGRGTRVLH